jgi:phage anti-repressor protein
LQCPNEGLLGMAIGVSVDAQDNVWMVHRNVKAEQARWSKILADNKLSAE